MSFSALSTSGGFGLEYRWDGVEQTAVEETTASYTVPLENLMCTLSAYLPSQRYDHTMDGNIICGGHYDFWEASSSSELEPRVPSTTCDTLTSDGVYKTPSHALREKRAQHSSWMSPAGLVLIGGYYNPRTTELLLPTDSSNDLTLSTQAFDLEYDTL